tara:strand:- start:1246 stop:1572 length:327 start_codon:yes stop_codon:yes gene_type:complete
MNLIKRSFKKMNFPKRNLYTTHDYTDLNDYSLVPAAYVVTISSILWGFESYNDKKNIEDNHHYLIDEIFTDCLRNNYKKNCYQYRQNLYIKMNIYNYNKIEKKINYIK